MSDEQNVCLKWNNHGIAFNSLLHEIYMKECYSDGKLVCQEEYYPIHQFVLSTCSEYFKKSFDNCKKLGIKHPVLIINDVKPFQMKTLLSYMYKGNANIPQDMLPELFAAAETYKIKGLAVTNDDQSTKAENNDPKSNTSSNNSTELMSQKLKQSSAKHPITNPKSAEHERFYENVFDTGTSTNSTNTCTNLSLLDFEENIEDLPLTEPEINQILSVKSECVEEFFGSNEELQSNEKLSTQSSSKSLQSVSKKRPIGVSSVSHASMESSKKRKYNRTNVCSCNEYSADLSETENSEDCFTPTEPILSALLAIHEILRDIREDTRLFAHKLNTCNSMGINGECQTVVNDILPFLPCKSLEEFEIMEDVISNKENKSTLIRYFHTAYGRDGNSKATNIVKRLLSDHVARNFNWLGQQSKINKEAVKKRAFSQTNTWKFLTGYFQLPELDHLPKKTEKDLKDSLQKWLENANSRLVKYTKRNSNASTLS